MTIKSALLLVDIQYDFLPGGSLAVSNGDSILPHTYTLLDNAKWDLVIASQDFHPPNHISFASRHNLPAFTSIQVLDNDSATAGATKKQELWPDHCVQGTKGTEFEEGVKTRLEKLAAKVVQKGADSEKDAYSAFALPTGKSSSPLIEILKGASISELFVVGLATDYCVKASVLSALEPSSSFIKNVYVIEEAVKGVDPTASAQVLKQLAQEGAKVVSIDGPEVRRRFQ
ncbi:isochorismatase family hydrolase [Meredithblackwellia eburnea MCA 4105]